MSIPVLDGIKSKTISTERITTRVLFTGPDDGEPILFLHGNLSSATWWEEAMLGLPDGYRGIAPDQRGFGVADREKVIDATRGMLDLVEDALGLMDYLGVDKAHVAGFSLGGMVIWRFLMEAPERMLSAVLVNPGSPYGFGATKDLDGTPTTPDFAGSGGGMSNPELIQRLKDGDTSLDSQFSPRTAIRTLLSVPPFISPREDVLLDSMLASHIGEKGVPGDFLQSPNWPHVAPGVWGASNATSPKYAGDVNKIIHGDPKHKILWVRGSNDQAVSDTAASDPGYLGRLGLLPGWPGEEEYPPQPMIGQTRKVLEDYANAGGSFEEYIIEGAGHVAWIEKPDEFNELLQKHLQSFM